MCTYIQPVCTQPACDAAEEHHRCLVAALQARPSLECMQGGLPLGAPWGKAKWGVAPHSEVAQVPWLMLSEVRLPVWREF